MAQEADAMRPTLPLSAPRQWMHYLPLHGTDCVLTLLSLISSLHQLAVCALRQLQSPESTRHSVQLQDVCSHPCSKHLNVPSLIFCILFLHVAPRSA